ncbi:MAG: FAD/NAD(P)-binding protein [Candidatus Omnitrophica bacterium]|nr:FAD/NAD(P)-binding protein [Candidatus Omnitrophota bacterium]
MSKHCTNPYRPIETTVIDVVTESPTIKTIRLKPSEQITFETGQFIALTIPGIGEAPFTPSSRPSVKDTMDITVMKVGKVTDKIHELKKGDIVGLRGPLGTGYPVDTFKDKEILVVGGGVGLAPLRSLMYALFDRSQEFKKIIFRGGCKTPSDIIYQDEIAGWEKRKDLDLRLTVDVGDKAWKGHVGLVTTILDGIDIDHRNSIGVVCGPPIMMKFATFKLLELGFGDENIYLSMEKNMSCGIGKCGHCRLGIYYCCLDGPVFSYDKIKDFPEIWD